MDNYTHLQANRTNWHMTIKKKFFKMKRNKLVIKLILLLGFFFATANGFSQDPNFYIYLCFGQSNMDGAGDIEAQDKVVDSRLKVMEAVNCSNLGRKMGSWYTANPPLCRCYSGLSPADYFGRTMVANLPDSITVGIINVSIPGCKIELFQKSAYEAYIAESSGTDWLINLINEYGGNPYGWLVDIAKLAQKDGVVKGILLHQGESNTGDTKWPSKVKEIYNDLITDLELDPTKVPLFAGELVNADQGGACASMNPIIATLPKTISNSYVISSKGCTQKGDGLHFNSAGYRKFGPRYAVKALSKLGIEITIPEDSIVPVVPPDPKGTESFWFEAEHLVTPTAGSKFNVVSDTDASDGKYIVVADGVEALSKAAADSASSVFIPFEATKDSTYYLYARLNCPTADDDSFWMKLDKGSFSMINGLTTSGWEWVKITSFVLKKGKHKITVSYREDGASLDKICISSYGTLPTGMGETNNSTVGVNSIEKMEGYTLGQNYPNPFNEKTNISFVIPTSACVSLKVYNMLGNEVCELAGKEYSSGMHTLEFDSKNMAEGLYVYTLKADKFTASQKMIVKGE